MEYFTLEADRRDFQRFGKLYSPKRAILFGATIVVLSFLVLRASGFVVLEFNQLNSLGTHRSESIRKTTRYDEASQGTITQSTNNRDTNNDDSNRFRAASITSTSINDRAGSCNTESACLENAIRKELQNSGIVSSAAFTDVNVHKFDMSGAYWVPVFKDGRLSYDVLLNLKSGMDEYQGVFKGKIDFIGYGPCSMEHLRETLNKKIAKVILDSIAKDLKE